MKKQGRNTSSGVMAYDGSRSLSSLCRILVCLSLDILGVGILRLAAFPSRGQVAYICIGRLYG